MITIRLTDNETRSAHMVLEYVTDLTSLTGEQQDDVIMVINKLKEALVIKKMNENHK